MDIIFIEMCIYLIHKYVCIYPLPITRGTSIQLPNFWLGQELVWFVPSHFRYFFIKITCITIFSAQSALEYYVVARLCCRSIIVAPRLRDACADNKRVHKNLSVTCIRCTKVLSLYAYFISSEYITISKITFIWVKYGKCRITPLIVERNRQVRYHNLL